MRVTSFAAPLVAGMLSQRPKTPNETEALSAIASLAAKAIHMGAEGRTSSYGFGLVGESLRIAPDIMKAPLVSLH